jgi:hypothetical protein
MWFKKIEKPIVKGLLNFPCMRSEYIEDVTKFGFSSIDEMQICIDEIMLNARILDYDTCWTGGAGESDTRRTFQIGDFYLVFVRDGYLIDKVHMIKLYVGEKKLANELDGHRSLQKLNNILDKVKVIDVGDLEPDMLGVLDGVLAQVSLLGYKYNKKKRIQDGYLEIWYNVFGNNYDISSLRLSFLFDLDTSLLEKIELKKHDRFNRQQPVLASGKNISTIKKLIDYLEDDK